MKLAGVVVGLGVLFIGVAAISPGYAQEPAKLDILLKLTKPTVSADAVTRDDFRDVTPPPVDRLSDTVRVYVGAGDPRCFPGDADWVDLGRVTRRGSRAR